MKRLSLALVLCAPLGAAASCGSAFCMVDTQWSMQGVTTSAGTRLDLRYEYISQDRLQNGRSRVGVGEIPRDHDEVQTVNRNYVGTVDHTFNANWGVTATIPVVFSRPWRARQAAMFMRRLAVRAAWRRYPGPASTSRR